MTRAGLRIRRHRIQRRLAYAHWSMAPSCHAIVGPRIGFGASGGIANHRVR